MEENVIMQSIYSIGKRLEDIRPFGHIKSFSNTEMQMMREIVEAGETGKRVISSQLAKKLGVTRSAVSQMVNKLEKNNIVRRVPDKKDKKIAYIELSDFAHGVYKGIRKRYELFLDKVMEKLGEKRVHEFIACANEFLDACNASAAELPKEEESLLRDSANNARQGE